MRKPDFFIVGAVKCGTTALHSYLREHPQIFMPWVKEPYYFGSDLEYRSPRPSLKQYLELFRGSEGADRVGEASPMYLFSKKAAGEIKEFRPDSRVIIMLRNPVDMIHSHHNHLLKTGDETIENLEVALEAESERRRGQRIPERCAMIDWLYYRSIASFTDQVDRYFRAFGRDDVHIIVFDDFKSETARVFQDALRFLEVDDSFTPDTFEVVNPAAVVRSRFVRDLLRHPAMRFVVGRALMPSKWVRRALGEKLLRLNERAAPKRPLDPMLRRRLQRQFAPEIERLSDLLGRDLTHWCSDRTAVATGEGR